MGSSRIQKDPLGSRRKLPQDSTIFGRIENMFCDTKGSCGVLWVPLGSKGFPEDRKGICEDPKGSLQDPKGSYKIHRDPVGSKGIV